MDVFDISSALLDGNRMRGRLYELLKTQRPDMGCPIQVLDIWLDIVTILSGKSSASFESPLLKGDPGTLARDSQAQWENVRLHDSPLWPLTATPSTSCPHPRWTRSPPWHRPPDNPSGPQGI